MLYRKVEFLLKIQINEKHDNETVENSKSPFSGKNYRNGSTRFIILLLFSASSISFLFPLPFMQFLPSSLIASETEHRKREVNLFLCTHIKMQKKKRVNLFLYTYLKMQNISKLACFFCIFSLPGKMTFD